MTPLPTRLLTATATSLLLLATSLARGQLAPGTDGRALDANSRLGGGGVNTSTQQNLFNVGGLYVTGNVTAGRSFRGFSPIRDGSSLFLSLPTADLYTFQRDSTGLNNVVISRSPGTTNPFFNPSTTVTNAGAIGAGQNLPGTSVPRSSFLIPYGLFGSRHGHVKER